MNDNLISSLDDVIVREMGGGERLTHSGVEVIEGQYSFLDLQSWHQELSPAVLSLPGVVFTDIDEKTNRLRIGVTSKEVLEAVEKSLAGLSVPREAVVRSPKYVEHQPIASGTTNRVGIEIADPTYFSGSGCPAGRVCRRSDTSFIQVPHPSGPAVAIARGTIARPAVNSFTWNGVDIFNITGEADPLVGQAITKVGRTTGRTAGTVQQTCVNVNVSGTNITQLCQSIANYANAGGDSGSPVFRITTLPSVILVGINWGGNGTTSVFSPITNIQQELGALNTCAGSC